MRYLLIVLTFFFLAAAAPSPWASDELVGKRAPDFTLKDINGNNVSISSLKGKTLLINFWATWCPPCRAEMPSLNRMYNEYKGRGLVVLAVSTDKNINAVKDFLSKKPFDFYILTDADTKVTRQFKVFSLPTTFLIDKNGVIIQKYLGEEEWESPEIRKNVREILGIP